MNNDMTRLIRNRKLVPKYSELINKENNRSIGKSSASNNKAEKKKGLSVQTDPQPTSTAQSLQTLIRDKSNFSVYCDGDYNRSRSRVRKLDTKRRRIGSDSTTNPTRLREKSDLLIAPRRTRSSINLQTNRNSSQRTYRSRSESRQLLLVQYEKKSSPTSSQRISQDVKERTLTSIQEWKNRMIKSQTGTIPKQFPKKSSAHKKIKKESIKEDIKERTLKIDSPKLQSKHLLNEVTSTVDQTEKCHEKHGQTLETRVIKENEVKDLIITMKSKDQFINEWHLEYVPEIERERVEKAPKLSPCFLQDNINADQRKIIVEYLIRLSIRCHYPSYIIYQVVKLFNVAVDRVSVELENIQLLALTALWIVLKRELLFHKIPNATTILSYAKDMYINQENNLLEYEKKILLSVRFNTLFADPYTLLLYYINRVNCDSIYRINVDEITIIYFCGSYLLDVSMLDEALSSISECILAMAAAELALHFACPNNNYRVLDKAWCELWRRKHLMEWEEKAVNFVKRRMIQHAANVDKTKISSYIVYKKYSYYTHCRISKFLLQKVNYILSTPEFS